MRQNIVKSLRGDSKISRRLEIKYDVDALLRRYKDPNFRSVEGEKELDKLVKKYGAEFFDDLIKRLDQWDESEHEGLFWILSYVGTDPLVDKLWSFVNRPKNSFKPRLVALSLLKEMGQDIAPELHNLQQDLPLDFNNLESIMSESINFMLDALQNAKGSDQVQNIVFQLEEMQAQSIGGDEFMHFLIDSTFEKKDQRAADFLLAMSLILPAKDVREKARKSCQKLRLKGIEPVSPYIKALEENRLYKIYYTTDLEENLSQLSIAWSRENELIQVFVFLFSAEQVIDFFVTQNISKGRFEKEFYSELIKADATVQELDLSAGAKICHHYLNHPSINQPDTFQTFRRFSHVLEHTLATVGD